MGLVERLRRLRTEIGRKRKDVVRRPLTFADTVRGAKASANLYSLIETAKANELEPWAYLERVFRDLPAAITIEQVEARLPSRVRVRKDAVP